MRIEFKNTKVPGVWERWFAWHPVVDLYSKSLVFYWLETIERKGEWVTGDNDWKLWEWKYREINEVK